MEQPAINAPTAQVIAILESLPSSNGKPKGPRCTLTDQHLYINGPAYFQDHRGKWKRWVNSSSAVNLKEITSVSYEKQANMYEAPFRFLIVLLLNLIFSFTIYIPLIISVVGGILAAKQSMLCIGIGCEKIWIKTAWYRKEGIDHLYNSLLQAVSEAHKTEEISVDTDIQETFAGEPILAEFGSEYRRQHMNDRKPKGGFCILTPKKIHISGLHHHKVLIWFKSRKLHSMDTTQVNKVSYKLSVSLLPLCLMELVFILLIPLSLFSPFFTLLSKWISGIELYNTVMGVVVFMFWGTCWALIWSFPLLAPVLFGKMRVIIDSQTGKYGLLTSWYQKEELNHFQKTINKVIETNAIRAGQMQQMQYTESPAIPSPVVPQQSRPAMPQQPAPMVPNTQVSMQEGLTLLKEYSQLLQQGVIDQAEFDRIKTEILSKKD